MGIKLFEHDKEVLEILQKGRRRIEVCGWLQHKFYCDNSGAACASGAIFIESGAIGISFDAQNPFFMYIKAYCELQNQISPGMYTDIPTYNDFELRTKQDILNMYDGAIATVEARIENANDSTRELIAA